MPRPKLHKVFRSYIARYAQTTNSNYQIVEMMRASFDEKALREIGQTIPVESTVRRIRKEIVAECAGPVEWNEVDDPWEFRRVDPDGIPPHVCAWIATKVLTHDFIRRDMGFEPWTFSDAFDAVTRRTAMWIALLVDILPEDEPFRIWSIAWMYSSHEQSCERDGTKLVTRPFDDYVAHRPWASDANFDRYHKAVNEGWVNELDVSSIAVVLYRMQWAQLDAERQTE
jgi:hypothetical protein